MKMKSNVPMVKARKGQLKQEFPKSFWDGMAVDAQGTRNGWVVDGSEFPELQGTGAGGQIDYKAEAESARRTANGYVADNMKLEKENERLSKENGALKARIAELEGGKADPGPENVKDAPEIPGASEEKPKTGKPGRPAGKK